MQNLHQTFYAQYANSPILTGLLKRFNQAVDPRPLIEIFLTNILNPATATGWGLDVWGRIVGVNRVLKIPVEDRFFGFNENSEKASTVNLTGFDQARFLSKDGSPITQNYALTDDAFRKLIFCKSAANITDGAIQSLNKILMLLFADTTSKNIWIVEKNSQTSGFLGFVEAMPDDSTLNQQVFYAPTLSGVLNMNIALCYDWLPTELELTLMRQAGEFIRPSGVKLSLNYVPRTVTSAHPPSDALWNHETGYLTTSNGTYLTI